MLGSQGVRVDGKGGRRCEGSRIGEAAGRGTAAGKKLIVGRKGFKEAKSVKCRKRGAEEGREEQVAQVGKAEHWTNNRMGSSR